MKSIIFLSVLMVFFCWRATAQIKVSDAPVPKYLISAPPDTQQMRVDTGSVAHKSALELEWDTQTDTGRIAVVEKGTAGFFPIHMPTAGAGIYAFHLSAAKGTIIRVRNLNNDSVVFVKVLGPLPDAKRYAGCVIGLSNKIKAALGARDSKAFCELSYISY